MVFRPSTGEGEKSSDNHRRVKNERLAPKPKGTVLELCEEKCFAELVRQRVVTSLK